MMRTRIPLVRRRCRALFIFVSLLTVFVASWTVFALIEQVRESVDRAH